MPFGEKCIYYKAILTCLNLVKLFKKCLVLRAMSVCNQFLQWKGTEIYLGNALAKSSKYKRYEILKASGV